MKKSQFGNLKLLQCALQILYSKMTFILSNPRISLWIIRNLIVKTETKGFKSKAQNYLPKSNRSFFLLLKFFVLNNCKSYNEEYTYKLWMKYTESNHIFSELSNNLRIYNKLSQTAEVSDVGYTILYEEGAKPSNLALSIISHYLRENDNVYFAYGDYDHLENGERVKPVFTCAWNKYLFHAVDYLGPLCIVENSVLKIVLTEKKMNSIEEVKYSLLKYLLKKEMPIHKIEGILSHKTSIDSSSLIEHRNLLNKFDFGQFKMDENRVVPIRNLNLHSYKVDIIIPSKDNWTILDRCIQSILKKTTYGNYAIVVVNNKSIEKETFEYLNKLKSYDNISVTDYDDEFNFAGINNFAVQKSKADYICFLNDDTEVISENWLIDLMHYAVQEDVGAVGSMLLYPNATIQHAGIVLGMGGIAGHRYKYMNPKNIDNLRYVQEVSAVTAACLCISREKFIGTGMFDERLGTSFNDVDLCIRLMKGNLKNILVPTSQLYHYESVSRGSDFSKKNSKRYREECELIIEKWENLEKEECYTNASCNFHSKDLRILLR